MQSSSRPEADDAPAKAEPRNPGAHRRLVLAIVLFAAVVIIVGGIAFLRGFNSSGISGFDRIDSRLVYPQFADRADDMARIEIVSTERFHIVRSEAGWRLLERDGYPVPSDKVDALLESVAGMTALYISTEKEDSRLQQYGLAGTGGASVGTGTAVAFHDRNGNVVTDIMVGNRISVPGESGIQDLAAIRHGTDSTIWLVDSQINILSRWLDWPDREIVDIPRESVVEFAADHPDASSVKVRRNDEGRLVPVAGVPSDESLLRRQALQRIASTLEEMQFIDVRTIAGLDAVDPNPRPFQFVTNEGIGYHLQLFSAEGGHWVAIFAAMTNGAADEDVGAFNRRHAAWAYRLPPASLGPLTIGLEQLIE